VITIDKLGGHLFRYNQLYPFYLSLGSYTVFMVVTILLALFKQLND